MSTEFGLVITSISIVLGCIIGLLIAIISSVKQKFDLTFKKISDIIDRINRLDEYRKICIKWGMREDLIYSASLDWLDFQLGSKFDKLEEVGKND